MAGFYYWTKQLAQVLGLLVFLGVLVRTLLPGRAGEMRHCAMIPLEDEEAADGHRG